MRYEAWSLPWDAGGFKRKIAKLPVPTGSGQGSKVFLSTAEDGGISLNPDQFDRVGEVISSTVGSLIRVFDGDQIIHEWLAERNAQANDDERRELGVSGPGIKAAFDKAFIYAQDYPTNPSLQPNHVWAGEDALTDGGMEEANTQNETYEIQLDGATGGTFTLTVGGATTGALAFDATPAQIEAAIEGLASTPDILDVRVDDTSDGWNIEFVDPAILVTNMTWTPSLTGGGGEETLSVTQEGTDDVPAHWTVSKNPASSSNPKLHGTYATDGFRLTTGAEPVRSGDTALRVNGLTQYSGAQQIVNVEPGARYQASIWVWSSDTTESFKLVMRDQYGRWVAQTIFANTTGSQWEQLTIDFITELPDGTPVDTLIFRMAQIVDHNPIPFYLDDASLKYGAPAANPGEIMGVLMADVQSDHAGDTRGISLEWVDISSFGNTLDSSGATWTASHSFEASFGETYGQVLDKLVDLGYEWNLVPKTTPVGSLTHDLVIYNEGNLDNDPSTAITIRQGTIGGDVVKRIPSYTAVLVEGAEGLYVEAEDATAVTNFGRIEAFFAARHLTDTTSLIQFANQLLTAESANRTAVRFEIVDTGRHPVPLVTYQPGDTLPMQMPPLLSKEERRVQRVDYTNTHPTSYVVTGSRVLRGEAAAFDLIRRLWRRFERPHPELRSGVSPLQNGGGFGTPTIVVAAFDATVQARESAHFQCRGVDDHVTIMAAVRSLESSQGGRILFTEGSYHSQFGQISLTGQDRVSFIGMGRNTTEMNFSGGTGPAIGGSGQYATIRDIGFYGPGTGSEMGIHLTGQLATIENCLFQSFEGTSVLIDNGATNSLVSRIWATRFSSATAPPIIQILGFASKLLDSTAINGTIDWQSDEGICHGNTSTDARGNSGGQGLLVQNTTQASFEGNVISFPFGDGIEISGSDLNSLIGNILQGPSSSGANVGDGIHVSGSSSRNHFAHNHIQGDGLARSAIRVEVASATENEFIHNSLGDTADYATDPIIDNGTDTIFHGNILDGQVGAAVVQSNVSSFSQAGSLSTGVGAFKLPFSLAAEIISVQLAVGTSPTGANLIVDLNKNGTTVFTTQANRPTVLDADADGVGAEAVPDVTSIAEGEYLTVDIDQVGSTEPGQDLTVVVEWRPA